VKFPRNARIFRGQLDAAPFAAVFFLLVIFLILGSRVYTPGVPLKLPVAGELPGTDKATVSVAIDARGGFYFENHPIDPTALLARLRQRRNASHEPMALLVQADKDVRNEVLVRVALLARDAGFSEAWLATLPQAYAVPETAAQ
jgi:biopolymer transport protein ExbD